MSEARSRTTDHRYYGLGEAIVTDVNDPEKEGRVKVRYPWFDDDTESDWCRVAQLYAGNGYGTYFVPEIDDEVIVAFVHGDLRLPIVMGSVYNGRDKPAVARDSSRDPKLIRTRAGHQILLDDTSGQERIEVTDKNGNVVLLDSAKNAITIEAKGDLNVKGAKVSIEASGAVSIKGSTIDLN